MFALNLKYMSVAFYRLLKFEYDWFLISYVDRIWLSAIFFQKSIGKLELNNPSTTAYFSEKYCNEWYFLKGVGYWFNYNLVQIFLITNYFLLPLTWALNFSTQLSNIVFSNYIICKLKIIFLMFESYNLRVIEVLKSEDFWDRKS